MEPIDAVVVVWLVLTGLVGMRRGLAAQAVALLGFAGGAVIGSRVAPLLLHGGSASPWKPIAALAGAVVCGLLVQAATTPLADHLRASLRAAGPLDVIDRAGGLLAGTVLGLLAVWMLAVAVLHQPGLGMRRMVQRSAILPPLVADLPASALIDALQRFDQLPVIAGFAAGQLPAPDPALRFVAPVRRAARSVVKVDGTACGMELEGSGWVVRPGLVATNAHVVAGESDTHIDLTGGTRAAVPVYISPANDVALLRVPGLDLPALRTGPLGASVHVALAGYAGGGPLAVVSGTAGRPVTVMSRDAYGHGLPQPRSVVPLRGRLRHGDSGGPAIDAHGRVVAMMFAASEGGSGGFGVPVDDVLSGLDHRTSRADTGPCLG